MYTDRQLLDMAKNAMKYSYSPYSHFAVGACVLMKDGSVFTGCNIENSSYGATICAERAAVCNAVSSGYRDFKAIAIVGGLNSTGINGITYPCGICRQVLSEFSADMYVIAARSEDDYDMRRLSEFLPASFGVGQME